MYFRMGVLENFTIFKTPKLESLFNKNAGLKTCNLIKKSLQHRCFSVKFAKFLRTPYFTEHIRWVPLKISLWTLSLLHSRMMNGVIAYGVILWRVFCFFLFLSFFVSFSVDSTTFWIWGKFVSTYINKVLELFLGSLVEFQWVNCFSLI